MNCLSIVLLRNLVMYLEDDFKKKFVIFILSHLRNIRVPFYICVLWKCFVKLVFFFFHLSVIKAIYYQ